MATYHLTMHEIVNSDAFEEAVRARRDDLLHTFAALSPEDVAGLQACARSLRELDSLVGVFKSRASREKKV